MKALQRIRKAIKDNSDSPYFGGMESTAETLRNLYLYDKAKIVYSDTEDRGDRWTKWEVEVYKVISDNEIAYFRVEREVGATECQSDGDTVISEVVPKEVTIIKYVDKN